MSPQKQNTKTQDKPSTCELRIKMEWISIEIRTSEKKFKSFMDNTIARTFPSLIILFFGGKKDLMAILMR